jgi:hypothetical protein
MTMIALGNQENNEIYFSLLSGTVGLFLPHPTPNAPEGREVGSHISPRRLVRVENLTEPRPKEPH